MPVDQNRKSGALSKAGGSSDGFVVHATGYNDLLGVGGAHLEVIGQMGCGVKGQKRAVVGSRDRNRTGMGVRDRKRAEIGVMGCKRAGIGVRGHTRSGVVMVCIQMGGKWG